MHRNPPAPGEHTVELPREIAGEQAVIDALLAGGRAVQFQPQPR